MKAILCKSFGSPDQLVYEEVAVPKVGDDEVLIRVRYCGVNFPDTLIVQGKYQFSPDFPFVPGGEVSGTVEQTGKQVRHVKQGDQVLAAMGWGGFAEYAVAKGTNTYLVPPEVPLEAVASLLETYATTIYALKDRALLKPGETLVVLGAGGGTGTAAVQLGHLFGARVVAVASTAAKRQFAMDNGARDALDPGSDLKERLKALGGADVIFDPVGGPLSEIAFRSLRPGGRHLVVGFASGEIPNIPLNLPLLKSAAIVGVFWGHFWRNQPEDNRRNVNMLLKWLAQDKITPKITKTYPLNEGALALQDLIDRKVKGKVQLEVDSE